MDPFDGRRSSSTEFLGQDIDPSLRCSLASDTKTPHLDVDSGVPLVPPRGGFGRGSFSPEPRTPTWLAGPLARREILERPHRCARCARCLLLVGRFGFVRKMEIAVRFEHHESMSNIICIYIYTPFWDKAL